MATLGSLPIGAKIKVPHSVLGDIVFLKCDQNHEGYPENSTTLITDELILLRAFDAKEPNNTNSDRQQRGNNRNTRQTSRLTARMFRTTRTTRLQTF